ncbi:MAG: glycerophosphodiester phosphodiesterase [Gemmatimonadetes bacterium]|nr:glycerophosphodiester phosphodiesterase [Gemmatimonadota bacterium]NNM04537.1 glycerophosphodiester phosphodiesterase [Gemmatimonadota bacterium]
MNSRPKPEIIAHRGYSAKAPENTLAALEAALETGAESVEFDLHTAACGTPVLFHDAMLGRTTNGVGPVRRRPLPHLKALDAGGWFGPEFSSERIPTQDEALANLKGRVFRVYQDIKGYREMEDLDRMVSITRERGMAEATVFTTSDWVIMNRLRRVAPEIRRSYLAEGPETLKRAMDLAILDEGSLLSLELEVALAHRPYLDEALREGAEVMVWTVNDESAATQAVELGVSRIVTDEVEKLLAWRFGRL